jgi:hypothetical protein
VTDRQITASTDDDGDVTTHYHVSVRTERPPFAMTQEVAREAYSALAEGSLVPVRRVPSFPSWSHLGETPRADGLPALALALALSFLSLFFLGKAESGTSWYDKPRITDTGSGRLPEAEAAGGKATPDLSVHG